MILRFLTRDQKDGVAVNRDGEASLEKDQEFCFRYIQFEILLDIQVRIQVGSWLFRREVKREMTRGKKKFHWGRGKNYEVICI